MEVRTFYNNIVMSHSIDVGNQDNMKKSKIFAPLNKNQRENNDSLKLSILSYIKAVNKKKETVVNNRSRQHEQDSDLNKIVNPMSTENTVHYVKRKRKSLTCQESLDNSTESIENSSFDMDSPQKKQLRLSTEPQQHVETNNLMPPDDIRAINDLLECLKTYRNTNVAEQEEVVESAELTNRSLTSINQPTEMIENFMEECAEPLVIKPSSLCEAKMVTHPNEYQNGASLDVNIQHGSNKITRKVINMTVEPFTIKIPPQCNVRITVKHNKCNKEIFPVVNVYSESKHTKVIRVPEVFKSVCNEDEIKERVSASSCPNKLSS